MATHSSVLAWRIPGMGEPGGLPSMGSHRVGHDWSDLAAAAACYYWGFPGSSAGKESTCNSGDLGSIAGLGRSPGEGIGYPFQHFGLDNSMDCIVHAGAKSRTWQSHFHFHHLLLETNKWNVILELRNYYFKYKQINTEIFFIK